MSAYHDVCSGPASLRHASDALIIKAPDASRVDDDCHLPAASGEQAMSCTKPHPTLTRGWMRSAPTKPLRRADRSITRRGASSRSSHCAG